jgi:hypothetical protein
MRLPSATVRKTNANNPDTRTVEVFYPGGRGFLLHLWVRHDGTPIASVERADPGIVVMVPANAQHGAQLGDSIDSHAFTTTDKPLRR